jgi:hypothetical protein
VINSWNVFETQFKTQFLGIQKAKKMPVELQREMVMLELRVEDLDKMELYGGVEVEMHKIHAKKLLNLAKWAKIDTGAANIVFVRNRLPEVLKNKVDKSHTNWTTFCTAIKMVDKAYKRDRVWKYKE